MLKKAVSKAAGESKPEAYPQGYVEDFDEGEWSWRAFSASCYTSARFERPVV